MSRLSLASFLSLALAAVSGLQAVAQTTTWSTAFTGTAVPNGETYVFVDGGSISPGGNPTGTLSLGTSFPSGTSSVLQFSYTGSGTSSAKLTNFGSVIVDGPGSIFVTNSTGLQANTFNGDLVLRSGTMIVNASIAGGNGNTIFQGGALQYALESDWNNQIILTNQGGLFDASRATANNSINQTISGTGSWTLIASGSASVASTNGFGITYVNPTCNFTGTTTIAGGKAYPSQDNVFGDSTQIGGPQANNKVILDGGSLFTPATTTRNFVTALEVGANGGYLDTYSAGQRGEMRFNAPISGTGQLTLLGGGLVILTTSNAFSGTLVTSTDPGATFTLSNVNALRNAELNMVMPNSNGIFGAGFGTYYLGGLSGSTSIAGFGTRAFDIGGNGRSTTFSGNLDNMPTLTKSGTGTLTLTGTTVLFNNLTGQSGITTITGGVLAVNSDLALGAQSLGSLVSSTATVTLNGGTLKQTVAFNSARALTIQSAGGGIDTSTVGSSAVVSLSGNFTGSGNLTLAANGDLTGSGTGNLALTGTNTYTGTTTITSGMVSAASSLGNAANTLVLNGGGLIALSGTRTNSYATVIGLAQGTLKASAASDVLNQAAVMSGSGGLRASGNGTVNLQAANTFSGDTRTLSGTMDLAHGNALQNSLLDMNAADTGVVGFTAGTTTYNVAGLQGSRGITFSSGTLSVGSSNASTTYSGPLGGTGRLVKVGSGDLTLTGTNSYAGGTVVSAGRLVGTTDGLQGTITNNAAVEFAQATAGTYAGNLSGSGSVTKSGTGAVTLSGTMDHTGGTLVSGGTLIGTTTNLQGVITNNAAVEFAQATSGTYLGNVTGSGSVTKSEAGALTLSGTLDHTGGTLVSGGTLIGTTDTLKGAITNNAAVAVSQSTSGTYSGSMTGSGSLTKLGSGTVTLAGTNSYGGGTVVSAGRLVGTTSSLQGAITNNAAVTVDQASNGAFAGAMAGSGSLTKLGSGTATLTSLQSFVGPTTVSAGALALSGTASLASSLITVGSGAMLDIDGRTGGSMTLGSGQTLAGTGNVSGLVVVGTNATVSPGSSPGTLSVGSMEFAAGGNYNWQVYDASGASGSGYDYLSGTGSLAISAGAGAGNQFNINLWTLSGVSPDVSGPSPTFNKNYDYRWKIAEFAGGISGFNADAFLVQTAATNGTDGFANDVNGTFTVAQGNPATFGNVNQIYVVYAAAPEPATWGMAIAGLACGGCAMRRKRRRVGLRD